ncbi:CPBP family intramembrane glutamic endopeptidase [Listeria sp. PSOL-1]|uniref:CPBP family intramembrane glutamic endopeptidase n=1 Tax=Listeria sp. PSOL-1 TaxID=1844999 RepID=UPI0013D2C6E1|nr:type II CAAX endopeptidase family protein [Listeria sp. PSOL-1]
MPKHYFTIIIIYFTLLFGGAIGAIPIALLLKTTTSLSPIEITSYSFVIWTLISNIIMLLVIWRTLRGKPNMNRITQGQQTSLQMSLIWMVGGTVSLFFAQYLCGIIISLFIGVPDQSVNTTQLLDITKQAPIFLLFISLLGPIIEEFVFRKALYGGLANIMNIHVAAVISSLIFAILHGDIQFMLSYFVIGLILCYLYTKTKRLSVSIGAHVLMNTVVMLMSLRVGG